MKKVSDPDMRAEYDFRGGVRGKHYKRLRHGHTVRIHKSDGTVEIQHFKPDDGYVMLEPDVRPYFPDSESVNRALRALIALIPEKPHRTKSRTKRQVA
jgi:hypothetical protein